MTPPSEIKPTKNFEIGEMISRGWNIMWENKWQIVGFQLGALLIFIVAILIVDLLFSSGNSAHWFTKSANHILHFVINGIYGIGLTTWFLKFADLKSVTFKDFFSKWHLFLPYLLATILGGICTLLGLLCFIIPGIIVWIRFSFFSFFIIDQETGPIQALEESWNTVKGVTWKLFLFWCLVLLINLAGLLVLGVGLLFTYPATLIASILVYRSLWNQTNVVVVA